MLLIVDANVLVGESLRERGRALMMHHALDLAITDVAWAEAQHELEQRLARRLANGTLSPALAAEARTDIERIVQGWLHVLPAGYYQGEEVLARRRIPRDPDDWPTVAAALVSHAGIWTHDCDFLGCGCPTWSTETLLGELAP